MTYKIIKFAAVSVIGIAALIVAGVTGLIRLVRPEWNLIFFHGEPTGLDPEHVQTVVSQALPGGRVRNDQGCLRAELQNLRLTVEHRLGPLDGASAYKVGGEQARTAVAQHRSWTMVTLTAPSAERQTAEGLLAELYAGLLDPSVTAAWSSIAEVVKTPDELMNDSTQLVGTTP